MSTAADLTDYRKLDALKVAIFADGADPLDLVTLAKDPDVKGFTTNPTLIKQAGVRNYEAYARDLRRQIPDEKSISFEVLSDRPEEIYEQAKIIWGWGSNLYVKVPVITTEGTFLGPVIERLHNEGVSLNITAIFTQAQIAALLPLFRQNYPVILSLFVGRIADTLRDVERIVSAVVNQIQAWGNFHLKLLWASCREPYNILQAENLGCDIITVTSGILMKRNLFGKDLFQYSRETVNMFVKDAQAAGLHIPKERKKPLRRNRP